MSTNFRNAVDWLEPICRNLVKNGSLNLGEYHPSEAILQMQMQLLPRDNWYDVTESTARELLFLADTDPGAFDLSAKISSANIFHEKPLPPALRLFAAEFLSGSRVRPPGRRRDKTWMENQYKFTLVISSAAHFGLRQTRNEASAELSACDAVSQAFERADYSLVSYENLRKICVSKRYEELRNETSAWANSASVIGSDKIFELFGVTDIFRPPKSD